MPAQMIRCSNVRDGVRCHRRNRVQAPKGVRIDAGHVWKCESCMTGGKPFEPRSSARKGQQKQQK